MKIRFGLVSDEGAFYAYGIESSLLVIFLRDFSHNNLKDINYKIEINKNIDGIYVDSEQFLKVLEDAFAAESLHLLNIKNNKTTDLKTILLSSKEVLIFPFDELAALNRAYVLHLNNRIKNG
jgi:hypothetical protein|tara:strand:+ start:1909 stop:2274 length:366 start_codon:yes stop_codon:yes gene_type:complete